MLSRRRPHRSPAGMFRIPIALPDIYLSMREIVLA
jgi:hypothetical protein